MQTEPALAETLAEIRACLPTLLELRPHLDKETFAERIAAMKKEGFELAYLESAGAVVTVAGFRTFDSLCHGRTLYVDDLVTSQRARSQGHGARMLGWLQALARQRGCDHINLDSGTHRHAAHRFYLGHGFDITDFHFARDLEP